MKAVIQLQGVTKIYDENGSTPALDGVSLDIRRGEVTLLMGPSGSGKTTLISIIGGILSPTSGSVIIAGTDIAQLDEGQKPAIRRRHIGFIFQSFNLMPSFSAAENVEVALELKGIRGSEARKLARELLDVVDLSHKYNVLPADLSGGEKQRVAIARALAGDPDIILADEPTAALDSASGRVIMEKLRELAQQGRAILIVTHDNRIMEYANRILQIADGKITSDSGERRELAKPNSSDAIVRSKAPASLELEVARAMRADMANRRSYRPWLILLLLVAAGWVVASQLGGFRSLKLPVSMAGPVQENVTQPVATSRAQSVISGAGQVEPESEELKIGASVPGRLLDVPVQEGQHLNQGDVIAALDNSDLSARVAQAEANIQLRQAELDRLVNGSSVYEREAAATAVAEAQAVLDNARAEVAQRKALVDSGDMARVEYERAEREARLAQTRLDKATANAATVNSPAREDERARASASLQAATAQLAEAKALLEKSVVRAPFAGVVLKRYHRGGEDVGTSNDPIISFGDVSRLVVRVDVDEADVGKIHVGDHAYCTAQAYGTKHLTGRVTHIGGQLGRKNVETGDPAEKVDTRVLETLIELDGHPRVPVGLRVDAFIEMGAKTDATVIPVKTAENRQ